MDFEIIWTEPAIADFQNIITRLTLQSPAGAERVGTEIVDHVESLRRFPFIGPLYERDPRGLVREITCRQYRIFYRVVEEAKRVEILTVWHGSRREPRLPI